MKTTQQLNEEMRKSESKLWDALRKLPGIDEECSCGKRDSTYVIDETSDDPTLVIRCLNCGGYIEPIGD